MSKSIRPDGRKVDEMREAKIELGVIPNANGSAKFTMGKTVAIAAVYGPRELHPRRNQIADKGLLRCNYDLMSFSVSERKRPGPSRRDKELSLVIANALSSLVFLDKFPKQVIDVFVEIPQADAGTRCAGICAASLALADAGIPMRGLTGSVSAGALGETVVIDLDKEEEDWEAGATDMPVTYCPKTNLITSLQLDGEISKKNFFNALELAIGKAKELTDMQEKALKENYKGGSEE
ncbi:MAG TPA: exosome complex exonuclease Rrp41 [Candidatus Nanoarchaeia archaeon]|nr:exosome complex exonuclease Rrp41 [Candidatus Nanoarchaeia archaeon]